VQLAETGTLHAAALWARPLAYTDREEIRAQSRRLAERLETTQMYASDVAFIQSMAVLSRDDSGEVRERPVVVLSDATARQTTLDVLPSNLHIRARIGDPASTYAHDDLVLYVDPSEFSLPNTSIAWLCNYYAWCLEAGVATVAVLHNDYVRAKAREGDARSGMYAVVVVKHEALFARGTPLALTPAEVAVVEEKVLGTLDSGSFSGWVVLDDTDAGKRYAVVMDHSKERTILPKGDDGDAPLDPVELTHNSPLCDIYPGMNPARKVWLAYLCTLDGAGGVEALPVGIQTRPGGKAGTASRASALCLPSASDYRDLLT
jgi:hypothetical protein